MSEENISLFQLLDLAIGTPQRGAVNFSALHALLHAVLRQLDIPEMKTPFRDTPPGDIHPDALVGDYQSITTPKLDHETEEDQHQAHRDISTVEQEVQPGTDLQERAASSSSPTPSSGPAATDQCRLQSRIQTCEDGVAKAMKLIQEVQSQNLKNLKKETQKKMKKETEEETEEEMKEETEEETEDETEEEMTEEMKKETKEFRHQQKMTTERPSVPSGPPQHPAAGPTGAGAPLAQEANGSETAEALKKIGKLTEGFGKLKARVAALEEDKVDQSQLMHLKNLITNQDLDSKDALNNLMDQLNQQQALIDSLIRDQDKLDTFTNITGYDGETTSEAASGCEESDSKDSDELRHQIFYLRKSVLKLEDDIKQLKARQASSMERAKDRHLQDQLDDLRSMLEDMMQSLTCQLSDAGLDESNDSEGIGQSKDQRSEFTISTMNTGRKLSLLFQHYEQLQDTVSSLLQQQTGGRAGPLKDIEDVELVNDVQKAILHLQAECQNLHETTRCLHEDNRQKQSHIDELYKTTEELGEKKADKEMVESEIKADKFALESKVSRLQFDSVTEQLNAMFHELLNKVTGHEQDWHKVIDKLSTEMECKLNRMELDSVKKQLENRWKNIHEKLQAQGAPEHEDAAGIRKQLVDRFHCLSCDRPVVMHTPGQHLAKQPSTPGFPSHKSIRPFTVYALEQFRQHYRSERISEMTEYSHLAASRSCGGSHTVTMAGQRRPVLQYMKHNPQTEVDAVIPSEEVDIIGLDGHIYKGRLNASTIRNTETKLPTISTKDGMCKTKDKAKCSPSHKPASSPELGHGPPVYPPHSAKSAQCSRSTSSNSGRDWPVSALGCTSQLGSVSLVSAAAESLNAEPIAEQLLNL
ncbi:glutamine-rich protein 2 isoform X2 [Perca fluviatilis]|uniref:glutamine-rich protein 2 isoform X2 n=1 Tax=Perca fluviatilis TaxID=8168 RepID=UPI001962EF02|nr:glutamine-rich protein 2 isoform X2 [Perca fluviatilis]